MPFTAGQFFDVFRRYNAAVWPAQIALVALALLIVYAAWRARTRVALVLLSALWLWTGAVYDKHFLGTLTPAGQIFGSLFIAQAALLLIAAWTAPSTAGRRPAASAGRRPAVPGAILIAYALVLYPAIGALVGQRYPAMPTFGTPCPTTIFTLGVFCLLAPAVPRFALVIPVLWSVIATTAAVSFGVHEDFALIPAAIVTIAVVHHAHIVDARRNAAQLINTPVMPTARSRT
jgi:hypothetical protein